MNEKFIVTLQRNKHTKIGYYIRINMVLFQTTIIVNFNVNYRQFENYFFRQKYALCEGYKN